MRVVLVTIPTGSGEEMARLLVEREVCACVNVLPGGQTIWRPPSRCRCRWSTL